MFGQKADGTFGSPVTYAVGPGSLYGGIEVADVTGDHRADVIATISGNSPNSKLEVFPQNALGTLDPPTVYTTLDIPDPVEAADMNQDGRLDVVVVHGGYLKAGVYLQDTNGSLSNEALYPIPYATRYRPNGVAIGDVNNDDKPDIAISDYNNGLVVLRQILPATATPTASATPTSTATSTPTPTLSQSPTPSPSTTPSPVSWRA